MNNTLTEPFVNVEALSGKKDLTLPGVLAEMAQGNITSFCHLRFFQKASFHAFCVQLAALAMKNAEISDIPVTEEAWLNLIRGLTLSQTKEESDDPWCLTTAFNRPAFLQPPVPDMYKSDGNNSEDSDRLTPPDVLVTAKNHDTKSPLLGHLSDDFWFFSLINFQTMKAYGGRGNYGISRAFSAYSARPFVGVKSNKNLSYHWQSDLRKILTANLQDTLYDSNDGLALTWIVPWNNSEKNDGQDSSTDALQFKSLSPLYIEISGRVRLRRGNDGRLLVNVFPSSGKRIYGSQNGLTNDFWTPNFLKVLQEDKKTGEKNGIWRSWTHSGEDDLSYQDIARILKNDAENKKSMASEIYGTDSTSGLVFYATSFSFGKCVVHGFSDVEIPISELIKRGFRPQEAVDKFANTVQEMALDVAEMAKYLDWAASLLLTNASLDMKKERDPGFKKEYNWRVGKHYYEFVKNILQASNEPEQVEEIRKRWLMMLYSEAVTVLKNLEQTAINSLSPRKLFIIGEARNKLGRARYCAKFAGFFDSKGLYE